MNIVSLWLFVVIFVSCLCGVCSSLKTECAPRDSILFLPLDERFTTRDAFLNLAGVTSYCILTPPPSLLPSLKVNCDLLQLHKWVDDNIGAVNTAIISSEMYLYGGLITSRTSNDSTPEIMSRLDKLMSYSRSRSDLTVFVSNVVMRIPAYNGDFEEPWYWADYGYDLFSYSFYWDKYNQLGNKEDLTTAQSYEALIPANALNEFKWRRERNFNVTSAIISELGGNRPPFKFLYITLDDNAEYGFNIREAANLKSKVLSLNLSASVPIYPGADEVQLVQLARFSASRRSLQPRLAIVYRDSNSISNIPNYEGQPMRDTLLQQIAAAGAIAVESLTPTTAVEDCDGILLVNNFATSKQVEAPNQPTEGDIAEYIIFSPFIEAALTASVPRPIGFCDNKYSNGGDKYFVEYMRNETASVKLKGVAYAGWNTNGNTIGTVVANTVLLTDLVFAGHHHADSYEQQLRANQVFNSLRILEDMSYQAGSRQSLSNFADSLNSPQENSSNLVADLEFYERFSFKLLNSQFIDIVGAYDLNFNLESIYYPWNRTFEIGLLVTDE